MAFARASGQALGKVAFGIVNYSSNKGSLIFGIKRRQGMSLPIFTQLHVAPSFWVTPFAVVPTYATDKIPLAVQVAFVCDS